MFKDSKTRQEYDRKWYHKNKERIREAKRKDVTGYRERRRKLLAELKSSPCKDCGQKFDPICMDFDHLRDKKFNIADAMDVSEERLLEEVKKCDLVCACCHRLRTKKRSARVTENGRRAGLRGLCPKGRTGSNPVTSIMQG